jgi:hypothetical protein
MLDFLLMSLKLARKENFYNVILNCDQFAETVTYKRPGASDAQIVCVVRDAPEDLAERQLEEIREQKILVRIGRDPAEAKGGIQEPRIGDAIVRQCFPDWTYSFQGRTTEVTPHSFTLEFARRIPDRVGKT